MATTCGEELFIAGGGVPSNVLLTGPGGRSSVTVKRYSLHFLTLPLPPPLPLPLPGEAPEDPLDTPCLPSSWVLAVWFLFPQRGRLATLALQAWGFTTRIVATSSIMVVPIAKGLRLGDVALRVDVHCREAFCSLMRDALASIEDVPPFLPYVSKVLPC